LGAHLGDDCRRVASLLLSFLSDRRQHIGSCKFVGFRGFARLGMMVAKTPLVTSQPLRDPLSSRVEGRIGFRGRGTRVDNDAAADMERNLGPGQMRLLGYHNMRFDRRFEIFPEY